MFKKLRNAWGWLNTPVNLLFKPMPEYDFTENDERSDDYWEEREEKFDPRSFQENLARWNEQNAFPVKPSDFIMTLDAPSAVMDGMDSMSGAFSLAGSTVSGIQMNWYTRQGFIGFQSCAIIAQHWLVNRACSIPGKDAIRNGFDLTTIAGKALEPEIIQDIVLLDEEFQLKRHMLEFSRMNRVFGIRICLFMVKSKDKKYYEKPFNLDGVTKGSYQGMVQVDPYWITPELDGDAAANPASPHFYEPTFWRINGKLYHRSHLVITRYAEVADVLKPNYIYGGIPLTQMIYERAYAAERSANEIPELLLTKRLSIIRTDTKKVLANMGAFMQRIAQFTGFRNNQGVQILDKSEEFDQVDTTMTQVNEVMEGQYDIVSAISEIPVTKLMNRQITGLNSNGAGDRRNYEDVLEDEQCRLDPLVNRHHLLTMKSHIEPKRGVQTIITHTWNPVTNPTAKEAAEIRKSDMETAKIAVEIGALSGEDVHKKLMTDKESGFSLDDEDSSDDVTYEDYDEFKNNEDEPLIPSSTT